MRPQGVRPLTAKGPLWAPAIHHTLLPISFTQYSAGSKALERGLAPVVWGLSLAPGTEPSLFPPLPSPHPRNNGRCKETAQSPRLESGFGARYIIRIMDQYEIRVRAQSVTNIRAQSITGSKAQSTSSIWGQSRYVIKAWGLECGQDWGSAWD